MSAKKQTNKQTTTRSARSHTTFSGKITPQGKAWAVNLTKMMEEIFDVTPPPSQTPQFVLNLGHLATPWAICKTKNTPQLPTIQGIASPLLIKICV